MYQATHKVDQQDYAIKKIVLRVHAGCAADVRDSLLRMLKEVRFFAAINDPHVVRYNHSWLEVTECVGEQREKHEEPAASDHIDPELELQSPFIGFDSPADASTAEPLENPSNPPRQSYSST